MMQPTFQMPHNIEAEQALLGALLVSDGAYHEVSDLIAAKHFYAPVHQKIFTKISECINAGRLADATTIKAHFEEDPALEERGGSQYIFDLASSVITVAGAPYYAQTIKDMHMRREMLLIADKMGARARNLDEADLVAAAEKDLTSLVDDKARAVLTAGDASRSALEWMERIRKGEENIISTGIDALDDKLGGLFPGSLYIVAGRPGMGKTALGVNVADNISAASPVLFLSLEMMGGELAMRMIAARTGIPVGVQRSKAALTKHQWERIVEASAEISARKLTISETTGINVHTIKTLARRHYRQNGKFTLVIDYLGLIAPDRDIINKVHQIEDITTNLKSLAKELGIPVILLAQLSRNVEKREEKRPLLSDLRDSGSIEQDADVIMFVYRDEYYDRGASSKLGPAAMDDAGLGGDKRGEAEVIIAKNRQHTLGTAHLSFDGCRQRFS